MLKAYLSSSPYVNVNKHNHCRAFGMVKYRSRCSHPATQQFPVCVCSVVLQVYSGNSNITFTREAVGAAHARVSPQFTRQKCEVGGAMTIASVLK